MNVTPADRRRLDSVVADRAPRGQIEARRALAGSVHGRRRRRVERDKTRKPGKPSLPATTVQRVVDLALGLPPGEATHWTGRMLAKAAGHQPVVAAHP